LKKLIEKGRKPDIVFLDYLQRMQVDKGPENYSIKMGAVTKGLKNIAKEMNIPFVALAQINRANGEAFPRIMDLKESGEIEADADIIILLHREEFYNRDCKEEQKGKIQVDIAKNRNGPLEFMSLNFEAQFTRITDSDRSDEKLEDD
jgi:replicative DNA helicase